MESASYSLFLYWKSHSQARSLHLLFRFLIRQQLVRKYRTPALSIKYCLSISGPVHTYPDIFESANVSFRIRLPFRHTDPQLFEEQKFLKTL